MQSSDRSSDRGHASRVARAALLLVLFLSAASCAGKRPMVRPPSTPREATRQPGETTMPEPSPRRPAEEPPPVATQPSEAGEDYVALPGLNRVFPSEDPMNVAKPSAPEAFPAPGHSALADGRPASDGTTKVSAPAVPRATPPPASDAPRTVPPPASTTPRPATPPPVVAPSTDAPSASATPRFCLQLFATGSAKAAEARRASIATYLELPLLVQEENGLFKVRSNPIERKAAEHWLDTAVAQGYEDAFLVPVVPQDAR